MIIIDNREGKLIDLIKSNSGFKLPYELQNLPIGDIIISPPNTNNARLIIERKCITDLIASIKDGRYKEQKARLQAEVINNPRTLICYIVEGTGNEFRYPADKVMFNGSIVSCAFRDKIPLIRTTSLKETMEMIGRLYDRMVKDINDFFPAGGNASSGTGNNIPVVQDGGAGAATGTYLETLKKCKKENLNPKLWNQIALSSIPGVSTNIAQKVTEVFPSIKQLLDAYESASDDQARIKLVSEIVLTDNGKTKRRIGNVVAQRIMEYLYLDA
jgi:crossover junction endonuclease MUS81